MAETQNAADVAKPEGQAGAQPATGQANDKQKDPEKADDSGPEDKHKKEAEKEAQNGLRPVSVSSLSADAKSEGQDREDPAPPGSGSRARHNTLTATVTNATAYEDAASAHISGMDAPAAQPWTSYVEIPDAFYDRLTAGRKTAIVGLMSYCSFLAPISSTAVLPAIPDLAAEFGSTGTVVNISNGLYMLFMGLSPIVWGPLSEVYGRRRITVSTLVLFVGCCAGTALAPNLAAYFVFRVLTAFEGTAFILVGSAAISDIYRPVERATAMGWFLSGTLVGPAFGPFLGGIIVTYASWRVIFWLQTGLAGAALAGVLVLLPETIHHRKQDDLAGYPARDKARVLWRMIRPTRVIRLYVYPNLVLTAAASSALLWNMYSLLTPIRYVLNPRFGLTTPMQSGLIYLAPGCGYLAGTLVGGRYADYVVRRWIVRRGGRRVPEDRLRSALPFMGIVLPACMLVYGWCVDRSVGGIPLATVVLFLQGVAQLFCFPSLNTYCLDVMPAYGSDVIAGNYFVRYLFGAAGTAVVLPAVEAIGVGWFSTISAAFVALGALGVYAAVLWGERWRYRVDDWQHSRRQAACDRARAGLRESV